MNVWAAQRRCQEMISPTHRIAHAARKYIYICVCVYTLALMDWWYGTDSSDLQNAQLYLSRYRGVHGCGPR